ncbi:MAG: mannose-1-phosphate guanylyltransferase/mannose-6-phosphate isomerase [bacterium]|nr:mannose-1-phosphate guanylyltransferase/mannose-6-phosphate isomerase [bacterium]
MYSIILAGGSGSRLWPLSRDLYPKQLLNINSDKSLLQATFARLCELMPVENIVSITNGKHLSNVKGQLAEYSKDVSVLSEPTAKNTAPAIAAATKFIMTKEEDPIILVVPSDSLIKNTKNFVSTVNKAEKLAQEGYIVTFGIEPSYPETGYGYINVLKQPLLDGFRVKEFVEKPDLKTAKKYLEEGTYYWNGGIFMFKASVMMEELKKYQPHIFEVADEFDFSKNSIIEYNVFNKMPSISIDYAVMEKSDKIALIKLESDWNDLGSWQSIYDVSPKDENNNVLIGNVVDIDSKDSLVYSSSKLVSTIGMENTVVVETEDAILVCDKDKTQDVKKVYEILKEKHDDRHLIHKTVYRPWGFYTVTAQGDGFLSKLIHVNPKQKLSLQSHNHRSEHWVVMSGKAKVILDSTEYILDKGNSIDIPLKAIHSLQNPFDTDLEIIEAQLGDLLIEDDIIRYEDMYGRV